MKVYVVERNVYSDRYLEGVYATPEAAMAANPSPKWEAVEDDVDGKVWRIWDNGLDWSLYASISEHEVTS
jgi:hypothetical protein